MRSFQDVAGKPLEWVRVGGRRDRTFSLRARGQAVATLEYESLLSHGASGRSGDGAWSFERTSVIRPTVRVDAPGKTEPVAHIVPGRLLGPVRIDLTGGDRYGWRGEGAFPRWQALRDPRGSRILRARTTGLPVSGAGVLEIDPAGFGRPALPLLCMCAWYLLTRDQGRHAT